MIYDQSPSTLFHCANARNVGCLKLHPVLWVVREIKLFKSLLCIIQPTTRVASSFFFAWKQRKWWKRKIIFISIHVFLAIFCQDECFPFLLTYHLTLMRSPPYISWPWNQFWLKSIVSLKAGINSNSFGSFLGFFSKNHQKNANKLKNSKNC